MASEPQKDIARPRFFTMPVENKKLSAENGRKIFEDRYFVELKHPGDRSYSFVEEIDESGQSKTRKSDGSEAGGDPLTDYADRFPREFMAFKRGEQRATVGTPLDEWSQVSRSRGAELKAMNIFTVEELADVQDSQLPKMGMGAREEREKAKAFINASKAGADTAAMAAELARLKEMVERLTGAPTVPVSPPAGKLIEDATNEELKAFIKRETGQAPRGNPSRETLLAKAKEAAQKDVDAA
jgi:hypothetical protein